MADFTCLTSAVEGHILHIQLYRPQKANALNGVLWHEIRQVFVWADRNPEVRVILLSGAGKYFCAGIDFELIGTVFEEVNALAPGRKEERLRQLIVDLQEAFTALEACRKPVLAAVHGLCLGAGLDLIAACDMRYASREAKFSLKEVDLGIVADVGSLQRLPRLMGEGLVRELAFTGREMEAGEAQSLGLVNRVFDNPQELLAGVRALARTIAAKSPLTVRGIKEVMNYNRDHSVADGLRYVAALNSALLLSADCQEAVLAAMEKRPPEFPD
ncbi:MAG: crotonase/enoyl-CoA hydratase family protein [Gammaproteobacteria bacterium]|nr:crotonase/enoyl-CoA hydratase family protein [Gammaproteobacteria bacterium]MCP5425473.1 crotonase/enoyl-CoA hydratase family protein [Gammaproteobacteria bacterium]MCP5459924.1 crotonase/enoyl-CoA hydratase family protein [Gammaproteobacteria bacterium]